MREAFNFYLKFSESFDLCVLISLWARDHFCQTYKYTLTHSCAFKQNTHEEQSRARDFVLILPATWPIFHSKLNFTSTIVRSADLFMNSTYKHPDGIIISLHTKTSRSAYKCTLPCVFFYFFTQDYIKSNLQFNFKTHKNRNLCFGNQFELDSKDVPDGLVTNFMLDN